MKKGSASPVYIVSGGTGMSGRQIVESALAQFPTIEVPVIVRKRVRTPGKAEAVVRKAASDGGIVVHTLVDGALREELVRLGGKHGVGTIDLMGPLLARVARDTGAEPLGKPGLYRQIRKDYYDRIEAIDFAVAHDDGHKPEDIPFADIVILGVSRCGKTPLSMYLAVHGWKVANVPILKGVSPPVELFRAERRRVVGLVIEYRHLLEHRRKREELMGRVGVTAYSLPSAVFAELEEAKRIYRKGGFTVVDVTDRPVELVAGEIARTVARNRSRPRRRTVPY